jgi:hypothetical protein
MKTIDTLSPNLRAKILRSLAVYRLEEKLGFVSNSAWDGTKSTIDDSAVWNKPKGQNTHDFSIGTYNLAEREAFYNILTAIIAPSCY